MSLTQKFIDAADQQLKIHNFKLAIKILEKIKTGNLQSWSDEPIQVELTQKDLIQIEQRLEIYDKIKNSQENLQSFFDNDLKNLLKSSNDMNSDDFLQRLSSALEQLNDLNTIHFDITKNLLPKVGWSEKKIFSYRTEHNVKLFENLSKLQNSIQQEPAIDKIQALYLKILSCEANEYNILNHNRTFGIVKPDYLKLLKYDHRNERYLNEFSNKQQRNTKDFYNNFFNDYFPLSSCRSLILRALLLEGAIVATIFLFPISPFFILLPILLPTVAAGVNKAIYNTKTVKRIEQFFLNRGLIGAKVPFNWFIDLPLMILTAPLAAVALGVLIGITVIAAAIAIPIIILQYIGKCVELLILAIRFHEQPELQTHHDENDILLEEIEELCNDLKDEKYNTSREFHQTHNDTNNIVLTSTTSNIPDFKAGISNIVTHSMFNLEFKRSNSLPTISTELSDTQTIASERDCFQPAANERCESKVSEINEQHSEQIDAFLSAFK